MIGARRLDEFLERERRRREGVVQRVRAQEGEPWSRSLLRIAYLTLCVLFDGLVLTEIPRALGRSGLSWILFAVALFAALVAQVAGYKRWFHEGDRATPQ